MYIAITYTFTLCKHLLAFAAGFVQGQGLHTFRIIGYNQCNVAAFTSHTKPAYYKSHCSVGQRGRKQQFIHSLSSTKKRRHFVLAWFQYCD